MIDAVQWTGKNWEEIKAFAGTAVTRDDNDSAFLWMVTMEGRGVASLWATYEAAE